MSKRAGSNFGGACWLAFALSGVAACGVEREVDDRTGSAKAESFPAHCAFSGTLAVVDNPRYKLFVYEDDSTLSYGQGGQTNAAKYRLTKDLLGCPATIAVDVAGRPNCTHKLTFKFLADDPGFFWLEQLNPGCVDSGSGQKVWSGLRSRLWAKPQAKFGKCRLDDPSSPNAAKHGTLWKQRGDRVYLFAGYRAFVEGQTNWIQFLAPQGMPRETTPLVVRNNGCKANRLGRDGGYYTIVGADKKEEARFKAVFSHKLEDCDTVRLTEVQDSCGDRVPLLGGIFERTDETRDDPAGI